MQKLLLSGSDVFYALNEMRRADRNESMTGSWTTLIRAVVPAVCWLTAGLGYGAVGMALDENPTSGSLQPIGLRCDDQEDPLNVGVDGPRLSWVCAANDSARRGLQQTAYQVLVASNVALLRQDRGDLWDSGCVASDQSVHVLVAGRPLASRGRYFWKMRGWDQDSQPSTFSQPAAFATGLTAEDWTARWIAADSPGIKRIEIEDGRPVWKVGSGDYHFEAPR